MNRATIAIIERVAKYHNVTLQRTSDWGITEKSILDFENSDINWGYVSRHFTLNEEFMEMFQTKLYWVYISQYQKLSEKFIRKYLSKLDINLIINCQKRGYKFRFLLPFK
jgi:hypothetical protein